MQKAKLVSAVEAAAVLGKSERTVRRWIHAGLLEATRVGRCFEVDLVAAAAIAQRQGRRLSIEPATDVERLTSELEALRFRVRQLESAVGHGRTVRRAA